MLSNRWGPDMQDDDPSGFPLVAVAIDKDKGSQNALKWAIDNLAVKGQTITLVHVNTRANNPSPRNHDNAYRGAVDPHTRELFLPFRCFCTRKDMFSHDVVLEETDVAKAICEFVSNTAIEKLVVGAPSRGGFVRRFRVADISSSITKGAPDFCTVYVISKGKVSSMRNAVRPAPATSPLRALIQAQSRDETQAQVSHKPDPIDHHLPPPKGDAMFEPHGMHHEESIRSPFMRGKHGGSNMKSYPDLSLPESDISFVSSGRSSFERYPPRLSSVSDSYEVVRAPNRSVDSYSIGNEFSSISGSSNASWSSQGLQDEIEAEMKRLKLELKQTMDMYSTACKEALTAKQKAMELHHWKIEEEHRMEEAKHAEGVALALVEKEKAKCRAAMEAAEASQRIAELEAQKRISAEMKAIKEAEERKREANALSHADLRYRKYTIEEIEKATDYFAESRKIGEGGYGPVYRCYLDHTPVAIKVLRPDAAQGRSQFQQEVEVLSCIRHPSMVLLLGACPEYGCLVYEYMANGSLEDRLCRRGGTPVIPWQYRFRIAAEIATGLLFLHQTKPEPIVHRDLKPGNILLDRNYVSKISDVGLARLVPPSIADTVTQYRMTSTAGTFCYIDPEYQQTGMLGVKSDIYSLGIMLLQIITAKPPMGLTHIVGRSIKKGTFEEMVDPAVDDWPVEEAKSLAEVALKCSELRRKDRPDLATVVLPELNRLRALGEESIQYSMHRCSTHSSPNQSQISQDMNMSDPQLTQSGYDSSRS